MLELQDATLVLFGDRTTVESEHSDLEETSMNAFKRIIRVDTWSNRRKFVRALSKQKDFDTVRRLAAEIKFPNNEVVHGYRRAASDMYTDAWAYSKLR